MFRSEFVAQLFDISTGNLQIPVLLLLAVTPAAAVEDEPPYAIAGPESPYLSGRVSFHLETTLAGGQRLHTVSWFLDGRQVARVGQPPYRVTVDLGPDVLPHRISATVLDEEARELWRGEFRTLGLSVAYSDRVALVVVPVTVLHPEGWFHTGLSREAFRVFEDGVEQELTCFANDVPLMYWNNSGTISLTVARVT